MLGPAGTPRSRGRVAIGLLVVALGVAVTPVADRTASASEHLVEVPIEGFCAGALPAQVFADVPPSEPFRAYIQCLAGVGVTEGMAGGERYEPGRPVTRGQLASFVARLMDTARGLEVSDGAVVALPGPEGVEPFTDVPSTSVHGGSIHRLRAAGIVIGGPGGAPPDEFRPDARVTREQVASVLVRSLEHLIAEELVAERSAYFVDVAGGTHQPAVDFLGEIGIALGDDAERFNPEQVLHRAHVSAFLVRSLAVLQLSDYITAPSPDPGSVARR